MLHAALQAGFFASAPANVHPGFTAPRHPEHVFSFASPATRHLGQTAGFSCKGDSGCLAAKLAQEALLAAEGNSFNFDAEAFTEYVMSGIRSTQDLLALVPDSGPGYESNCEEVREKIAAAMAR